MHEARPCRSQYLNWHLERNESCNPRQDIPRSVYLHKMCAINLAQTTAACWHSDTHNCSSITRPMCHNDTTQSINQYLRFFQFQSFFHEILMVRAAPYCMVGMLRLIVHQHKVYLPLAISKIQWSLWSLHNTKSISLLLSVKYRDLSGVYTTKSISLFPSVKYRDLSGVCTTQCLHPLEAIKGSQSPNERHFRDVIPQKDDSTNLIRFIEKLN